MAAGVAPGGEGGLGGPVEPVEPVRRWWAAAPDPELPVITAKRAYAEVLLVFAGFFLAGVLAAALILGGHSNDLTTTGSWGLYGDESLDLIGQIGLAVAIVWLLADRRGVSRAALGLRLPRLANGRVASGQVTRILAWAVFAQVVGGIINASLQTGHLPTTKTNAPELIFSVVDSVQAGIIEELVVLAFVVVTLRQARRPWWEVTVVALVLRGSYHIYYGPGVFGILVWAALFYWIYLRTRSLIPLMVCHMAWDAVGFLSERWAAVAVVAVLVAVALWIAAPITWLAERNSGARVFVPAAGVGAVGVGVAGVGAAGMAWAGGLPPPGWHPDPGGTNQWRWWDGYRWTDHLSGPSASGP